MIQFISTRHAERLRAVRCHDENASSMSEMNKLIEKKVIEKTVETRGVNCRREKASEPIASLMSVSKNKRDRCSGDIQTPCSLRTATVTPEPWRDVLDFEWHHEARSRTCHRIQGHERVNSVEALMTALTQQLVSVVIEADSVLFQLHIGGDMQFWSGKYQWDDRTGSDADQDVQGQAFNKNS